MGSADTKGRSNNLGNIRVGCDKSPLQSKRQGRHATKFGSQRNGPTSGVELFGADALDLAQEPRELDEERRSEAVGVCLERSVTALDYQPRLVLQGVCKCKQTGLARKLFGNQCAQE
jgi:hypothetical protein